MRDFAIPAADVVRDEQQSRDPLFLNFFGDGWDKTISRQFRYTELGNNFRKVGEFATDGIDSEYGDRHEVANRLTIRCDDIAKRCTRGTVTYVTDGRFNGLITQQWHMNLCPKFFNLDHAVDRAQKTKTPNLINLVTREHIILHEMLHADIVRKPKTDRIVDIVADLGRRKDVMVYGPANCEELAKKNKAFELTSRNADSYAWFATAVYVSARWPGLEMTAGYAHDELRDERKLDIYGDDEQLVHENDVPPIQEDEASPPPPPLPAPELNCVKDCCGFVPDQQWCNANCGGRTC